MAMHWRLRSMLSWWHTDLFGKQGAAGGPCAPCAATTQGIQPLLLCREDSILSLWSQLPAVYCHSHWSQHGIGPHFHNWGLPITEISERLRGAPQIRVLLLKIHPELCQGDPSTDGIAREIRDITWQEIGMMSQMGMDSGSRVCQQNVFLSLEASSSVWEEVECKLRFVNFRRVSDPRRAFLPAFKQTRISDD